MITFSIVSVGRESSLRGMSFSAEEGDGGHSRAFKWLSKWRFATMFKSDTNSFKV